jgi:SNF2 family DNA or RNA helicase
MHCALPLTMGDFKLTASQSDAVAWMSTREAGARQIAGGILAHDVGQGKTFITTGLLRDGPELWPTLVLVPKSTLYEWCRVLTKADEPLWMLDPEGMRSAITIRTAHEFRLIVATHSLLRRRGKRDGGEDPIMDRVWGRAIIDEGHVLKNASSLLHGAFRSLNARSKWILTATPIQNCAAELFSLAHAIGVETKDADLIKREFLLQRSNTVASCPEDRDTADLPELTVVDMVIELEGQERNLYELAQRELDEATKRFTDEDDCEMVSASASKSLLGLATRCAQACTHPAVHRRSEARKKHDQSIPWDAEYEEEDLDDGTSSKIDALVNDVIEHIADEKSVVFVEYLDEMSLLCQRFKIEGYPTGCLHGSMSSSARYDVIREFDKTDYIRVLLVQVACASCGINLQAASRVYLIRPQWNPAVEKQAVGRVHRSGQTRPVTLVRMVAADTIDIVRLKRQRSKLRSIAKVLGDDSMLRTLESSSRIPTP